MTILISGLVLFLGVHSISIANPDWRDRIVAVIGEWPWKGVYSILSLAGLLLIVRGYGDARLDTIVLYTPPQGLRQIALLLLVFVFPLALAAYFPGRIKAVVKHPMLASVKIWAFAHLLANGGLSEVVLFGSFLAWAVADRISMKRRGPRSIPTAPPSKYNDVVAVGVGLVVYIGFIVWLHEWLIGLPPT